LGKIENEEIMLIIGVLFAILVARTYGLGYFLRLLAATLLSMTLFAVIRKHTRRWLSS